MLHTTKKTLEDNKDIVSEDEKNKIIDAAAKLEEILKDENATKEQIEESLKVLTETSHKLSEAVYKKEQAKQNDTTKNKTDEKTKKEEDVIDAEVE